MHCILYLIYMKKLHVTLVIVVVVALVAVFVWNKNEERKALILSNPPVEQLLFIKKVGEDFTSEQQQKIEEFKAKILARAKLGVTLTKQEEEVFGVVISDRKVIFPNGEMVVNHLVLKFSTEEINLIYNALKSRQE